MTSLQDDYINLARLLKAALAPERGFAMWMQLDDGNFHYFSSAHRADVRALLVDWLARAGVVNSRDPGETITHASDRLKLEETCVELGKLLESCGHLVVLFLFDYGDRGSVAWRSNTDARVVVEAFLENTSTEIAS